MGGSGRDAVPQVKAFRPEATSHPPALHAQHLLYLITTTYHKNQIQSIKSGKGGHGLPDPKIPAFPRLLHFVGNGKYHQNCFAHQGLDGDGTKFPAVPAPVGVPVIPNNKDKIIPDKERF